MARPRKGVTFDNAANIHNYFHNFFQDVMRPSSEAFTVDRWQAEEALKAVPVNPYCDVEKYRKATSMRAKGDYRDYLIEDCARGQGIPDIQALDGWVLEYVTKAGWERCLSNLRQAKLPKHERFNVKLSRSNFYRLKSVAKAKGKTIDETLAELLKDQ